MGFLKNLFGIKPDLTSDEFIQKFLIDSAIKHVQLELYYKRNIILQVESLRHVPIWMDWIDVNKQEFKNGFVAHFFLKKKNIEKNLFYKNYVRSKDKLDMLEFDDEEYKIMNYVHFFDKDASSVEIGNYIKNIIMSVYNLTNNNTQILFNLRYLKQNSK